MFEGLYLKPYLCPDGVPTIGVGDTRYENGTRVTLADPPITRERAMELLDHELAECLPRVRINAGDAAGARVELMKWVRGGGRVLPGLVKRRAAEAALLP